MRTGAYDLDAIAPNSRQTKALQGVITAGIDIGSRQAKGALLCDGHLETAICASGVDSEETAERLMSRLLQHGGVRRASVQKVITTGYGRVAIHFQDLPTENMTEITCHGLGAHFLNPLARTVIDIGGQDCKAIRIDPATGKVVEFMMNDKCAAGTGRFLEKTADMLGYSLDELGEASLHASKRIEISSQCIVFAESEIISLKARGERREDIAAGVHLATARRVRNLVNRVGIEPEIIFTGGVSANPGMRRALEEVLHMPISRVAMDTVYCGALGAALCGARQVIAERSAA